MELWSAERVYVKGRFEEDWGVMFDERGMIQAIGPRQKLVAQAKAVYHYPDHILMPSLINPHQHGFHRIFRGILDFHAPFTELMAKVISPLSGAIDHPLFEAAIRVSFAEQALSGIGSVGEFHYLHNGSYKGGGQGAFAERVIQIALEMGIRLSLIYAFFDQSDTEDGKAYVQPLDVSLKEFDRLHEKYSDHPTINILPGIHGLEHASPEAVIAASELAEKHDTKLHIQLAERESDLENSRSHFGTTPLRALEKMGVLNDRIVIINGTLLDDEELALMAKNNIAAILCPSAAMARGDNRPNTWGMLREEIAFSLGGDSFCMNGNWSVADEIKNLEMTQRSLQKNMNVLNSQTDIDTLWDLGTWLPSRALDIKTSQLMPGYPADLMLVTQPLPCAKPYHSFSPNYINQLLFNWGASVQVTHVMVQGRQVVRNGALIQDIAESYDRVLKWGEGFLKSVEKAGQNQAV